MMRSISSGNEDRYRSSAPPVLSKYGIFACFFVIIAAAMISGPVSAAMDPAPPASPVRLVFIHHSTGEAWLADEHGGLGAALRDNRYYVSDTNYGWGPDSIGDRTDIGNWWEWFRGPSHGTYLSALYSESGQHSSYSRLESAPGGDNTVILFKSCFPNSALGGTPGDPVPPIGNNPLRGESCGSDAHTVANAKGIYIDLLDYFATRQDNLFVVVTAPPLSDPTYSANARAFNEWLVHNWLSSYPYKNVVVFDFYTVLTTNGGNTETNDLGSATGNHHRFRNGVIEHTATGDDDGNPNITEYASDPSDDHPTCAGDQKATGEFIPLLNIAYHEWQGSLAKPIVRLPNIPNLPTDPDSDGIYEDLNGNGRKDFNDVILLFLNISWISANEPVAAFDHNHNGRMDYNDVILLFGEVTGWH
jgi:PKD repeat protein